MAIPAPPSPCINVCVLDEADVCRGCYRSRDEIAAWTSLSATEQWRVVETARWRRVQSQAGTRAAGGEPGP